MDATHEWWRPPDGRPFAHAFRPERPLRSACGNVRFRVTLRGPIEHPRARCPGCVVALTTPAPVALSELELRFAAGDR